MQLILELQLGPESQLLSKVVIKQDAHVTVLLINCHPGTPNCNHKASFWVVKWLEQKICLTTSAPLHSWKGTPAADCRWSPDFWDLTSISTAYPSPWQTALLLSKVASKAVREGKSQLCRELTFPPG